MKTFSGFPTGRVRSVCLPEPLFAELLPAIDDLAELKVTLHVLWRLSQLSGGLLYVRRADLEADRQLLSGLGEDPREALSAALTRSVSRGVLLETVDKTGSGERIVLANTPKGRAAVAALDRGEWPGEIEAAARPNVFALYEQNIGVLTPLIADELRDAEETYPVGWIEEAFRTAVSANKRSWRYARAILERWRTEGRGDEDGGPGSERFRRRYVQGEYGEHIDH